MANSAFLLIVVASVIDATRGLVPAPLYHKQTSSNVVRTVHPGDFQIVTTNSFLINGVRKRISDWFRLPDYFIDNPVNPNKNILDELTKLHVIVNSNDTELVQGVDESYELNIPATTSTSTISCECATIRSNTVFGALRGLETFAQLLEYGWIEENTGQAAFTIVAPQIIRDTPAYAYRGLLVDTSRHFLPMELLLANLDAMAMNKLNVLHWHITDSQSWPYQSERYPELSEKGAYRPGMVYSAANIRKVVQEAYYRGIQVIPEFDLPGHSQAIGKSHPEWMAHCPDWNEPIDPTNEEVYAFIENLFEEVFDLFPSDMVHLGGDEVPLDCWMKDPAIQEWMVDHNVPGDVQLYEIFEQKLLKIAEQKQSIVWQEVFDLGINITSNTIVDVWKGDWGNENTLFDATHAGYQVLVSSCWYLDHLASDWRQYYKCDPREMMKLVNGTEAQASLIVGGHASMWGEKVDSTDFMSRVWPRASAVAERLWSGKADDKTIENRLSIFRCHMLRRGIDAGPVGPGFCGKEPRFNKNQATSRKHNRRHGDPDQDSSKA